VRDERGVESRTKFFSSGCFQAAKWPPLSDG
jgi:hypothetical protein